MENSSDKQEKTEITKIERFNSIIILLGIFFSLISFAFLSSQYEKKGLKKENIKKNISKIIYNGATIKDIKHLFESELKNKKNIEDFFNLKLNDYYPSSTSLTFILNDLLLDYYKRDSVSLDSSYLLKIRNIIKENELTNPFDRLEVSQKYNFENIRSKLAKNYYLIQTDINKITEELDKKNQLVNKYLDKSTLSFWLSITALVVSFILSICQIIQGYNSSRQIKKIMSFFDKKGNQ